ncbi:MAG: hypothetical protein HY674_04180 [Chloroflexi bacterium]|nr:hypothetical protein [Chloroflexota bacterium]
MISLQQLQRRLEQEVPAFQWHCQAVNSALLISGTELPEEIMITAALDGRSVPGSPFYLSGKMLVRWEIDLAARLICNELTPNTPAAKHGSGLSWDKLAEI